MIKFALWPSARCSFFHLTELRGGLHYKKNFNYLCSTKGRHALISTSTPEGRSNLDNASTVREDEV